MAGLGAATPWLSAATCLRGLQALNVLSASLGTGQSRADSWCVGRAPGPARSRGNLWSSAGVLQCRAGTRLSPELVRPPSYEPDYHTQCLGQQCPGPSLIKEGAEEARGRRAFCPPGSLSGPLQAAANSQTEGVKR